MPQLLIVYHNKTGNTERLAQAAYAGAMSPELDGAIDVRIKRARDADHTDLLWADGLLLGTPENFGYMSGALKDFFDRTFYEVEGQLKPLPCALFISAGNDGTGAVRAIRRIIGGYPFVEVQDPIINVGPVTDAARERCHELGMALAAGLDAGIY
jgi:multimeric flavodoxin WrbA